MIDRPYTVWCQGCGEAENSINATLARYFVSLHRAHGLSEVHVMAVEEPDPEAKRDVA
jgi:hypothetical protein